MKSIELWADGYAMKYNGNSGAGIILLYNGIKREYAIPLGIESVGRAELLAIIHGLKLLKEPCLVKVFSDNQVNILCITGEYRKKANADLWEQYAEVAKGHEIIANWVAMNSTEWNKRAIQLSMQAARTQQAWASE